jgi:predicted nucleic acid-binding protein
VARIVLSDASPLIGLALVGGVAWLRPLFTRVWIPPAVRREVLPEHATLPPAVAALAWRGETEVRQGLEEGWLREWTKPIPSLDLPDLDAGESECIGIAVAHRRRRSGNHALVLMGERAGRAVAAEHGLSVAGTAAVIGMAKRTGLIAAARDVFETLHRSDFRISADVIRTVLARVGESP